MSPGRHNSVRAMIDTPLGEDFSLLLGGGRREAGMVVYISVVGVVISESIVRGLGRRGIAVAKARKVGGISINGSVLRVEV